MFAEREELVKYVFPQLRKLCEQRSVTCSEIDLRWGIPNEETAEGKVLPICLREIQRCRPYFIGLLGERYGWILDRVPEELIAQEPWLREHQHHSITELEILHGVLNEPKINGYAFFYFRDPKYLNILPKQTSKYYMEDPAEEEICQFGLEEASRRATERRQKLRDLKERIRKKGYPVKQYRDPKAVGEMILQDFTKVIDTLYPEDSTPTLLDREALEHDQYAQARARVYVSRDKYYQQLDAQIDGKGPPLTILGESGIGKSALISTWALRYQDKHPDTLVIKHFIGASAYSADWAEMLRRIMKEIKRNCTITQEIPDPPDQLRLTFANFLQMAAVQRKVVLILDGLNQLVDMDQAPDLVWLPLEIPINIRLILSTLPGRSLEEILRRDWPTMTIVPLTVEERKKLIIDYLAQYTKKLNDTQVQKIAVAEQSANPLYLRTLLEELRIFGIHEQLVERIGFYLAARTVPELFGRILSRYETDYEREYQGLVRETLCYIWGSRRGLSEIELAELLGRNGQPLPRSIWSPFYLACEASLINRSGLLNFSHGFLRQAIQNRYLVAENEQKKYHLLLADYFAALDVNKRQVDELPWQLVQTKEWKRLYELMSNIQFFDRAWENNEFEVKAYWADIERNSFFKMIDGYREVIRNPKKFPIFIWNLGIMLADTGHPSEAYSLQACFADLCRKIGNKDGLETSLGGQAIILQDRGELDAAMALHKEQERICREIGNEEDLQVSLGNQANILYIRGEMETAMALHKEEEQFCRKLSLKDGLQKCLGNQAIILHARGDLDEAMTLFKEKERICRELGNKDSLSICLDNQALILHDRGELEAAMALHKEAERICRELGNKDGIQASLGNQATILQARGELNPAMALFKEQEQICRELDNKKDLQVSLDNQALILRDRGELEAAMALHKEAERICRELGNKDGIQANLGNQANILYIRGELNAAMALFKEQEQICRELGKKKDLQSCLGNQALIIQNRGELDMAMALYKEQEQICRELGNKDSLSISLGNQALILQFRGELDAAITLQKEKERISREIGNKENLSYSLFNQASILQIRGDLNEAMALYQNAERISRELGNIDVLQNILGGQAIILQDRGELDAAMTLYKEQEQICHKLGNPIRFPAGTLD